jgi:hypothetical protein
MTEETKMKNITKAIIAATMLAAPAMAQTSTQFPKHAEMICIPVWGGGTYRMAVDDGGPVGGVVTQTATDGKVMHSTVISQQDAGNNTDAIEIQDAVPGYALKRFLAFDFSRTVPEVSRVTWYNKDKDELVQIVNCTIDWNHTTSSTPPPALPAPGQ